MTRAIRKKSGTGVKTNWHFVWSCSEIDKMITRDPMIPDFDFAFISSCF